MWACAVTARTALTSWSTLRRSVMSPKSLSLALGLVGFGLPRRQRMRFHRMAPIAGGAFCFRGRPCPVRSEQRAWLNGLFVGVGAVCVGRMWRWTPFTNSSAVLNDNGVVEAVATVAAWVELQRTKTISGLTGDEFGEPVVRPEPEQQVRARTFTHTSFDRRNAPLRTPAVSRPTPQLPDLHLYDWVATPTPTDTCSNRIAA